MTTSVVYASDPQFPDAAGDPLQPSLVNISDVIDCVSIVPVSARMAAPGCGSTSSEGNNGVTHFDGMKWL